MRPTPYVASLRVYEPITAFKPEDQARWNQIAVASPTVFDEQKKALRRTIVADLPVLNSDGAHVLEHQGTRYIAPWSTDTRCRAALEDFKALLPDSLSMFFLPQKIVDAINVNLELVEDKVPHIITATWSIPPRWFALFEPADRIRGASKDGAFTILRTSISKAKQRCLFAHQSVVKAFGNGSIEQEIAGLNQWLAIFNDKSIVECDYGGLAIYLEKSMIDNEESGLDVDTSIEDVANSLAGLSAGDGRLASKGYERLLSRWRRVAAFEQSC